MANEYIVYKHTCPNGKVYIGITGKTLEERCGVNGRNYAKNVLFYKAIKKYGWQNIRHEILFKGLSKKEATEKEIDLIASYKSNDANFGYNISCGGESGNAGVIASEETRKKMSFSHRGEKNHFYGKNHTEESKQKNSLAHRGKTAWNKGIRGKTHTEETRKKMSEAQKGEKNHFYGKKHTAETIEKIKAARRARGVNCCG